MKKWYENSFLKALIAKIQEVDDEIGVVMYEEKKILVFLWKGIIVNKIYFDASNKTTIDQYVQQTKTRIHLLRSGFIPTATMSSIRKAVSRLKMGKVM